jgi:Uma2 family endonuclease
VVQPDLSIVCDPSKLDDRGCLGAPDLIVEVISPSFVKMDMAIKRALYERVGVKEYWIVYPAEKVVVVYRLDDHGKYGEFESYSQADRLPVSIFADFHMDLEVVFAP